MNDRLRHLFLVTDHLLDVHREWVNSDTPYVTEELAAAVDDCLLVFSDGDIPGEGRLLNKRVEDLGPLWDAYRDKASRSGNPNLLPGNGFWKALDQIAVAREAAKPASIKRLEPVAELAKLPGMQHAQIARMYGWVDGHGVPEVWRVAEELAKPGTHVGPDFIPPHERTRLEQEAREKAVFERVRQRAERKIKDLTEPASEPLADLVKQGVSARQMARMLKTTVENVLARCALQGLDPPAADYNPVANERAPAEPPILDAQARALDAQKAHSTRPRPDRFTRPVPAETTRLDDEEDDPSLAIEAGQAIPASEDDDQIDAEGDAAEDGNEAEPGESAPRRPGRPRKQPVPQ